MFVISAPLGFRPVLVIVEACRCYSGGGLWVAYLLWKFVWLFLVPWKLVLRGVASRTVQWTLGHASEEHGDFSNEKLPSTLGRQLKATLIAKNVSEISGQLWPTTLKKAFLPGDENFDRWPLVHLENTISKMKEFCSHYECVYIHRHSCAVGFLL